MHTNNKNYINGKKNIENKNHTFYKNQERQRGISGSFERG